MNQSIPTKMINNSKRKLPWVNREMKSLITKRNKCFKKMKQHPCKKNTDQYRETKRRLQKESRKAYWQYLENIICYDESIETVQKQKKNSGIISGKPKKTVQEWHLSDQRAYL